MSAYTIEQTQAIGWVLSSGQFSDDGLTPRYERCFTNPTPGFSSHSGGIVRHGVRIDAGASEIGIPIKSVHVYCRKTGAPTGPITVCIRKASDGTIAETLGTFDVQNTNHTSIGSFAIRKRNATYNIVAGDRVSVEYPSGTTDILEVVTNTTQGAVANHTSQSFDGSTWSNTSNPISLYILG